MVCPKKVRREIGVTPESDTVLAVGRTNSDPGAVATGSKTQPKNSEQCKKL